MKKGLLLSICLLSASWMMSKTITYTADNTTDFWNPERGFYHYSDVHLNGNGQGGLDQWSEVLSDCQNDNMSLLFRYFYLDHYNNGAAISQSDLTLISNDLAVVRSKGLKVVIRFSYGSSGYRSDDDWSFTEPTKAQMQAHMTQIKPVLAANADVIACVQAGFVGIWGEWYFSSTFGKDWSKPNAVSDRNDIINSLLDMTPSDRCVQLRTIHYITEYIGNGSRNYTTRLTDQTAFSASNQARLAHHNDAFCTSENNWGTYYDYNAERPYLANLGQYVPLGGETAGGDYSYYKGSQALADMEYLHYDYLNRDYHGDVIGSWQSEKKDGVSYYDIIKRRLGYRFQLQSLTVDDQIGKTGKMNITLKIYNAGFSNLYNKRVAYIVLKNSSNTYQLQLASDPRLWKSGNTTTITESLTLPGNIALGTYNVYLYMPDVYASIASKEAYAVRLANQSMGWSEGMNNLGTTVTIISGSTPDPGPNPPGPTPSTCTQAVELSTAATMQGQDGGSATWNVSGNVLTVNYQTTDSWKYTGVEFPIGNRSDIDSFSVTFRGATTSCEWVALHIYLSDGNNRYVDGNADYSIHTDEGWITATVTPNKTLWGSSVSTKGITMTKAGLMANPASAVTSSFQVKAITLHTHCTQTDAVTTTSDEHKPLKYMRDGRLQLRHDGHVYNVMGQMIH